MLVSHSYHVISYSVNSKLLYCANMSIICRSTKLWHTSTLHSTSTHCNAIYTAPGSTYCSHVQNADWQLALLLLLQSLVYSVPMVRYPCRFTWLGLLATQVTHTDAGPLACEQLDVSMSLRWLWHTIVTCHPVTCYEDML